MAACPWETPEGEHFSFVPQAVRSKIFDAYVKAGGDGSRFSATNIFSPHVTLGFRATNPSFVATDLFVENGAA
jgi:hypothetical protein